MIKYFIIALLISLGWYIGKCIGNIIYNELDSLLIKLHKKKSKPTHPRCKHKIGFID